MSRWGRKPGQKGWGLAPGRSLDQGGAGTLTQHLASTGPAGCAPPYDRPRLPSGSPRQSCGPAAAIQACGPCPAGLLAGSTVTSGLLRRQAHFSAFSEQLALTQKPYPPPRTEAMMGGAQDGTLRWGRGGPADRRCTSPCASVSSCVNIGLI